MTQQKQAIQLFEERKVRTVWDDRTEEWYFSVVDVIEVLTDSADPKQYIKRMRSRDAELSANWGTICTLVPMVGADGKQRRAMAATTQGMFRIIQSIPSPKAEPFKQWMAQVAADRLDQMQDPELSIQQAMADYKRLGYSDNWINQRLKAIEVRKDLTDAWKKRGVQEGQQFATLTDIITNAWSGFTTREYKAYKGLHKENLRDNMTNTELILNMLAEASAKDITEATDPRTLAEHKAVAHQGGTIARNARLELEARTGRKVVSPINARQGLRIDAGKAAEGAEASADGAAQLPEE
ncbi:Bro-N domain-containing protein [uncultured Alistipes sp.]|uniref:BRO-N domain-containing protein n=1 Tax=uncultured Alistipes sp. TaxID=538949 RepID=UPI0026045495|nr:Bro-N domain-containing protein [uncultured Alistipes sp.]